MKKFTFLLLFLFISIASFAQKGISFQGIARDPQGNAITNQMVSVKFTIGDFTETQNVDTDNFGVFSASIGTENIVDYEKLIFANIDENLKVEVDGAVIYDDKFNSTPYAKAAENGVPPGCIMPFAGEVANIPAGWLLCDGSSLATTGVYQKLFEAIGHTWGGSSGNFNIPDLRGMFIRGANEGRNDGKENPDNMALGAFQSDTLKSHTHIVKSVPGDEGVHTHTHYGNKAEVNKGDDNSPDCVMYNDGGSPGCTEINTGGGHSHTNEVFGGMETRPRNVTVNYIVKF